MRPAVRREVVRHLQGAYGVGKRQTRAAEILQAEWQRQPQHPRIPHYLIHTAGCTSRRRGWRQR